MTLISTDPSEDYAVLAEMTASTEADVARAVAEARRAQPGWAALSLGDRCERVGTFVDRATARSEEIATLIARETGRPLTSSRSNVASGIEYFAAYLATAERFLSPSETVSTATEVHRVYREPWGVMACICPWNYPFANVAWQCGQALIAGNAIVYKNSEENPLFAQLLAELIAESRVPAGVFTVLIGDGRVGGWLVDSDIDMISFTGSTRTGQAVARRAAEKFIPCMTELGGSSPCIVFDDADVDAVIPTI